MTEYALYAGEDGPALPSDDPDAVLNGINTATQWAGTSGDPLWLIGYRVWVADHTAVDELACATYIIGTGLLDGSETTFEPDADGWHEPRLTEGVPITLATDHRSRCHWPQGGYSGTGGYWATGRTDGRLTAPSHDASDIGQGTFKYGPAADADQAFNSSNYWISPILTDVDPSVRTGTGAPITAGAILASTGTKTGRGTGGSAAAAVATSSTGTKTGRGTAALTAGITLASTGTTGRTGTGHPANAQAALTATGSTARTGTATLDVDVALAGAGRDPDKAGRHAAFTARLRPPRYSAAPAPTRWTARRRT